MKVEEYEEYVRKGSSNKYTKQLAMLGLVGEVGELCDVVKKENIYEDMSKFEAKYGMSVNDKIIDEAGDCLWQLVNLLNLYNVSINQIIDKNVEKLNKRHGGEGKIAKDGGGVR